MRAFTIIGTAFFLMFSTVGWTQTTEGDPFLAYQAFLAQHKDMATSGLLEPLTKWVEKRIYQ